VDDLAIQFVQRMLWISQHRLKQFVIGIINKRRYWRLICMTESASLGTTDEGFDSLSDAEVNPHQVLAAYKTLATTFAW